MNSTRRGDEGSDRSRGGGSGSGGGGGRGARSGSSGTGGGTVRAASRSGDGGGNRGGDNRSAATGAATGLQVVKTSGERETFDERKLRSSLRRAGASQQDQDRVVAEVRRRLEPGMSTRRVHNIAFQTLRRSQSETKQPSPKGAATAARYSLQHALLALGPSGFPFEQFLGELLRHEGFKTRVGVRLKGRFVAHEVDLDARRGDLRVLGECKFRSDPNGKVDIKTALYVYGRANDLRSVAGGYDQFWLITNGRFTPDAERFGEGVGLYLLGWSHPKGESLRERIDRAGLHPVTCLTYLRNAEKQHLIRDGIVVVADLHDRPRELERLRLSQHRLQQVRREVDGLCHT